MMVFTKGILESASVHAITDYPDRYGEYWVFRLDKDENIDRIEKLEFNPIDPEYPSQWEGWQDIQYEVEHGIYEYYWAEELRLI